MTFSVKVRISSTEIKTRGRGFHIACRLHKRQMQHPVKGCHVRWIFTLLQKRPIWRFGMRTRWNMACSKFFRGAICKGYRIEWKQCV